MTTSSPTEFHGLSRSIAVALQAACINAIKRNANGAYLDAVTGLSITENGTVSTVDGLLLENGAMIKSPKFTGNSANFLSSSNASIFNPSGLGSWTMFGWISPDAVGTQICLARAGSSGSDTSFMIGISASGGNSYGLWVSSDGTATGQTFVETDVFTSAEFLLRPVFVQVWHDGPNQQIGIRINGGTSYVATHVGGVFSSVVDFTMGKRSGGTPLVFSGDLSSWHHINRLLTDNELEYLIRGGTGTQYPFTSSPIPKGGTLLSADGWGSEHSANAVSFCDSALISREISNVRYQVATFWEWGDSTGLKLAIATRLQDGGAWTKYKYDGIGLTDISTADDATGHKNIALGIDDTGILHVVAGNRNDALKYRKSTLPLSTFDGSLSSVLTMLGTNESSVTYPNFFNGSSGALYFTFRDGVSGAGDQYLYKYDSSAKTWSAAPGTGVGGICIQRSAAGQSPYMDGVPQFGSDGVGHWTWCWRDTTSVESNHDVYHLMYNEVEFTRLDGATQTMPITHGNGYAAKIIPTNSEMFNSCDCTVDRKRNRPHTAYYHEDGNGVPQMYVLSWNGTTWDDRQITTTLTDSFSVAVSVGGTVSRPKIVYDEVNDQLMVFVVDTNDGSFLRIWEASISDLDTWTYRDVWGVPPTYEPVIDKYSFNELPELHFLIGGASPEAVGNRIPVMHIDASDLLIGVSTAIFTVEDRTMLAALYGLLERSGGTEALNNASTTAITTATRTELATELSRIDVAIGTRSSHSTSDIRTELSTELARIDSNISDVGLSASQNAKLNAIYTATRSAIVTVRGVITQNGEIEVIRNEDYYAADDRGITWTGQSADVWPDLTGATATLYLIGQDKEIGVTIATPTGTQVLTLDIPASFTTDLPEGKYSYRLKATLVNTRIITLVESSFTVV